MKKTVIGGKTFGTPVHGPLITPASNSGQRFLYTASYSNTATGAVSGLVFVFGNFQLLQLSRIVKVVFSGVKTDISGVASNIAIRYEITANNASQNIGQDWPVIIGYGANAASTRNSLGFFAPAGQYINIDYGRDSSLIIQPRQTLTIAGYAYASFAATDMLSANAQIEVELI
jgi:hypothetical protein